MATPSLELVDGYMTEIAKAYGIAYVPAFSAIEGGGLKVGFLFFYVAIGADNFCMYLSGRSSTGDRAGG